MTACFFVLTNVNPSDQQRFLSTIGSKKAEFGSLFLSNFRVLKSVFKLLFRDGFALNTHPFQLPNSEPKHPSMPLSCCFIRLCPFDPARTKQQVLIFYTEYGKK